MWHRRPRQRSVSSAVSTCRWGNADRETRGVASAALRCMAIAAECLTDYKEQSEILLILDKVHKETGWRIDFLKPELKKKWGWSDEFMRQQQRPIPAMMHTPPMDFQYQQSAAIPPPSLPAPPSVPRGIVNPLMRTADFNGPTYPYQAYYVAPNLNQHHNDTHYFYRLID